MNHLRQTHITDFFENLCEKNIIAFNNGKQHEVWRDCKLLSDIAGHFPLLSTGMSLTQLLYHDIEWTNPSNRQYVINGFVQYFIEYYPIFEIIKYIYTSEQFITEEQHDVIVTFTKGDQSVKYIYTYLINIRLSTIYACWNVSPKYYKDARMIHNEITEIHRAHNIPCNFPDIQDIANNPAWLEPNQSWHALLNSPVLTDDFIAHLRIWRFLSDYIIMMYSLPAPHEVVSENKNDEYKPINIAVETSPVDDNTKENVDILIPVGLKCTGQMIEDAKHAKYRCWCCIN